MRLAAGKSAAVARGQSGVGTGEEEFVEHEAKFIRNFDDGGQTLTLLGGVQTVTFRRVVFEGNISAVQPKVESFIRYFVKDLGNNNAAVFAGVTSKYLPMMRNV